MFHKCPHCSVSVALYEPKHGGAALEYDESAGLRVSAVVLADKRVGGGKGGWRWEPITPYQRPTAEEQKTQRLVCDCKKSSPLLPPPDPDQVIELDRVRLRVYMS